MFKRIFESNDDEIKNWFESFEAQMFEVGRADKLIKIKIDVSQ